MGQMGQVGPPLPAGRLARIAWITLLPLLPLHGLDPYVCARLQLLGFRQGLGAVVAQVGNHNSQVVPPHPLLLLGEGGGGVDAQVSAVRLEVRQGLVRLGGREGLCESRYDKKCASVSRRSAPPCA